MPFDFTIRIYDVLCAVSEGAETDRFDARIVNAARTMIGERGSVDAALLYCSHLLD